MKIANYEDIKGHVTFAEGKVRVFVESGSYRVKFYKEDNLQGEMMLGSNEWGAYTNNNELLDWRIEFWDERGNNLLAVHHHLVHGSNVLLLPSTGGDIMLLVDYVLEKSEHIRLKGGIPWVFFEDSQEFTEMIEEKGIKILRIGDNLKSPFQFIIEEDI